MKAHIVGGGFAGLAAAALLIRNANVAGPDITIYEAEDKLGGGFFLDGDAEHGYNLPGSIFDKEFRCALDLFGTIPTLGYPNINVADQFLTFNNEHPFVDRTHILDRDLRPVHGPRYGLSLADGLALAKLSFTPETSLDGKLIRDVFSQRFFETEFWLLWSTLMGSLPQHSIIEFRRYLNRFVYLFPDLSTMARVFRSQFNQHEAFVKPLVAWLEDKQVKFVKGAVVQDIGFVESSDRLTANRLDYQALASAAPENKAPVSVVVAPDDIVLVTTGSQAADMSAGTRGKAPPPPPNPGRSWALWKKLAETHKGFGNPGAFFGDDRIADSRWVTFTVTTTGREFLDEITNLTYSGPGSGGLLTLKHSPWVISLSIFEQPEILNQPPGTSVWWGYGLFPEREGAWVKKPMYQCSGDEILTELLQHLRFEKTAAAIVKNSICIPCNMPYVNNIWLPRKSGDRPPVVPEGVTNLGLLGQYVELERDIAFTFEYSARTAWEAVHRLTKRGPPPPPVYQGQYDPKGVWAASKVFLGLTTI
ncbi:MAG: oleate hydratase [Roseiarcus sp.]